VLENEPTPSPTYYFQDSSPPVPTSTPAVSFAHAPRFEEHPPTYVKTSGLLLSHNYDEQEGWKSRGSYEIDKQPSPRPPESGGYQFGVDFINPDVGNKITFKTSVETNNYRYAAAFK
jgi:hypothetical protein